MGRYEEDKKDVLVVTELFLLLLTPHGSFG